MARETIAVVGVADAQRRINTLAAALPSIAGAAVRAAGATIGEGMARRAPDLSDDMQGTLARSVHTRRVSETEVLVGSDHGLARIVEDGGEITAERAEVLHFDDVYTPRVTMPARAWLRPAADEDRGEAGWAAQGAASRAIRRYT